MSERTLPGPPSTLGLYARAAIGSVPLAGKLPFFPGGGGDLPEGDLVLSDVKVRTGRLASYCDVCSFTMRDTLPATYPHILAFPLHMALMTQGDFPFPAVGLVHLQNRIAQRRPIRVTEELEIHVSAGDEKPHPKGKTFALQTTVLSGGETVWESDSINLRRGKGDESAEDSGPSFDPDLGTEAEWSLPGDLGRSYGGVSGDRNPIHMYGLTAKALGFPRQIAHGMWTKARCVAALEPRLPGAFEVEVAFKRPILLPSKVEFGSGESNGAITFGVSAKRDGEPHLAGKAA
ncbi:MAG TPA: MaoC/PaaZ C-terminal domain-containing protein, partial [Solirubrobacterales bacterium]|nr:MaoC/PaaZ C-terminal domain-containing protein [Solirubrobacterales bacterium]